ncbi:MAG TPA: 2-oxo acid dehydrogenase subunit E2 [Planctomycetota bacterium]|jgi:pyruvate/2-oxoglutarate dehydrogenase complex dihydrolipoamide acyltransferase (E2) component
MITNITIPALTDSDSGFCTIESWFFREGDSVRKGQPLLLIAVGKTSVEIAAPAGGVLRRVLFHEGADVAPGTLVGVIAPARTTLPAEIFQNKTVHASAVVAGQEPRAKSQERVALPPSPVLLPREGPPHMSPRARRCARALHVPLQALQLPADGKRITERDVLVAAAKSGRGDGETGRRGETAGGGTQEAGDGSGNVQAVSKKRKSKEPVRQMSQRFSRMKDMILADNAPLRLPAQREPLHPLQRLAAEEAAYSQQNIPQFTLDALVLAGPVLELQRKLRKEWGPRHGPSVRDFFIRALGVILAKEEFKLFRGVIDENDVVYRGQINVGFVVPVENCGVVAPVVKNADRLTLREISDAASDMAARAQRRALKPSECHGGLMTVACMEEPSVCRLASLVRPGQSAVLTVSAPQPHLHWEKGFENAIRQGRDPRAGVAIAWRVCLSADYRLISPELGARMLGRVKLMVETVSGV